MANQKRIELIEAVLDSNINQVEVLISQGTNLNEQDINGYTALHYAAQNYHLDIAKILLKNHANVDICDQYGNTPLFKAVFNSKGRGEMIKLLLSFGAQKELKNNSGVSPYELSKTIANYSISVFFE